MAYPCDEVTPILRANESMTIQTRPKPIALCLGHSKTSAKTQACLTCHPIMASIPPMSTRLHSAQLLAAFTLAGGLLLLHTTPATAERQLLWGDTHLHSSYSADAYLSGNFSADPDTAYRYARGLPVIHPYHGARVQIETPLDFLVVSDHAEFLGGIRALHTHRVDTSNMGWLDSIIARGAQALFGVLLADGYAMDVFERMSATPADPRERAAILLAEDALTIPGQKDIVGDAWTEVTQAADTNNRPGDFTAFIGWEWTSTPGGANLHRVIFTDGDAQSAATYLPYSRDDSPYPEDLWHWLEARSSATGSRFVSIPHNSNLSKGYMFPRETLRGDEFTAQYLALRQKWEPVAEVTQIKGDSETHPRWSPQDGFADFERYGFYIQANPTEYEPRQGDFLRTALKRGLEIADKWGNNPYRIGMIGSTDSHTGLASAEEANFHGKLARDSTPENKSTTPGDGSASGWDMSAAGLAAVWATDNTRAAIVDAFKRREVYATTGPRIQVKLEAAWLAADNAPWPSSSVPMGATLPPMTSSSAAPALRIVAMKDPSGANLDRIQVIKGWLNADGSSAEAIFDVAWSDGRTQDASGQVEPIGHSVDITLATYDNGIGSPHLQALWRDPQFDAQQAAFYYVRVLQIPTPRHSTYDAVALGVAPSDRWPASIQERAYTSPVWFEP